MELMERRNNHTRRQLWI